MQNNIVEYFSGHDAYRCGYCKSSDTNFSHGMWAHCMLPVDYERLLNRGWRRSGKYLYKPTNNRTCCPCYTISCHALDFHISKSQKKVLKKFEEFLSTGAPQPPLKYESARDDGGIIEHEVINYQEGTAGVKDRTIKEAVINRGDETERIETENTSGVVPEDILNVDTPKRRKSEASSSEHVMEQRKEKGQKAKFLRIERKRQRLASRGLNPDEEIAKNRKPSQNVKEIEDFLQDTGNKNSRLKIRTVKVGTKAFDSTFKLEHALYQKYQMKIHNDEASECTESQFKRFLCENPLNEVSGDDTGSYHQQYYLDKKLIAVGVVDMLVTCLSSVYFFYDPDFMALTLGTYGALREIAFVRQRAKDHPHFSKYYMGYYIHSCPKMRYKGNYNPSYLLCPETYKWKLLDDDLRDKLSKTKYCSFFDVKDGHPSEKQNINKVTILYRRSIMPYGIYELQRSKDDTKEIQEYCNLVGADIANNLCLYR